MKKPIIFVLLALIFRVGFAQQETEEPKRLCVTVGFLQGGGSLVGADLEYLVSKKIGIQAGAGFVGFGTGLNFHFKPDIRSSFVSIGYWHQGINESYVQSVAGPTFVWRAKKLLSAQLGFGFLLEEGPARDELAIETTDFMLLYSIGIYFPW